MKVEVWIATNRVGSRCFRTIEFDDEEWAEMTEKDRSECLQETAFSMIEWGYEEKERRHEP